MNDDSLAFSPDDFSGFARLFPLPNLVMFPHVMQAMHIFEPRYRSLFEEAISDDKHIALGVLAPGWEVDYEGRPALESMAWCVNTAWTSWTRRHVCAKTRALRGRQSRSAGVPRDSSSRFSARSKPSKTWARCANFTRFGQKTYSWTKVLGILAFDPSTLTHFNAPENVSRGFVDVAE